MVSELVYQLSNVTKNPGSSILLFYHPHRVTFYKKDIVLLKIDSIF